MTTAVWTRTFAMMMTLAATLAAPPGVHARQEPDSLPSESHPGEGCFNALFCYKPPADSILVPQLREKKWQAYAALAVSTFFFHAAGGSSTSFVIPVLVGAPELTVHPSVPTLTAPLLWGTVTAWVSGVMMAMGAATFIFTLSLGFPVTLLLWAGAVALYMVAHLYIGPITSLHAINAQMRVRAQNRSRTDAPEDSQGAVAHEMTGSP